MKKIQQWIHAFKIHHRAVCLLSKEFPHLITVGILQSIWESLTPFVGIYLSAELIEELSTSRETDRIKTIVLLILFSTLLIGIITNLLGFLRVKVHMANWYRIEHIFTKKMLDMDYINVENTETKNLMDSIYETQNSGGWGLVRVMWKYFEAWSAVITIIGGSALTLSLFTSKVSEEMPQFAFLNSPIYSVLIILAILAVTFVTPLILNKARSYWGKNMEERNLANRLFWFAGNDLFQTKFAADVRLYQQEKVSNHILNGKETAFGSKGLLAKMCLTRTGVFSALSTMLSVVFTGLVYTYVGLKALAGAFGIGMVTQYVASITKVSSGIQNLFTAIGDIINNAPFLDKVYEFLDMPNTMYQGSLSVEKRNDKKYEIEFKNVSFKYPGSEQYSLKNVSLKLDVGDKFAIVGMNGSGKTTFIKLLCRLYDPTEGEILLNGINIKKYNYQEYMNIFSIVFQDYQLFAYGLAENVAGTCDYDADRVHSSLEKVGFGDRLKTLSNGLDTYLYKDFDGSGVEISGGEAQKIALARAVYKKAPFTILDEPTAALDPLAEAEIYQRFDEISEDTTTIYISHRLSMCRICTKILVFDDGSIIQRGSHEELIKDENGKYFELWTAQAQYYTFPNFSSNM